MDEIAFLPADAKYAELFLEYRQDPITNQFNPLMNQSLEELRDRLSNSCSDWSAFKNENSFFWFISDGRDVVGTASLQNINRMMLTAEIGYGVFSAHRGKGFATKIIKKMTSDAFEKTNLRKLIAFVHEDNIASRRALEKNEYVCEGLLREHYLIGNIPANESIYGILRSDRQQ